ncbi:MAG: DUF4440 domain-containing protein [Candidatus Limnocylindrales bacterium]
MDPSVQPDLVAAAIGSTRLAFETALRSGDAAGAAAAYADDATLIAPAAEVLRGRPAIQQYWRTGVETGIERMDLTVLDLQQRGDVALEIGRYALHLVPEAGGTVTDSGRYLVVLRADGDGRWRRCAEMFSPDRPPTRAPS